ncbi:hypothetical protein BKA62DRAFT_356373 [Auriculariales sp. MPI-PUGE-AT-0066]|nr:hypothetical protein BKA62DRAFT_356373 [Auriculariales sp. MPI-PUGE-AT-0066]
MFFICQNLTASFQLRYLLNVEDIVVVGAMVSIRPGDAEATASNCFFASNDHIRRYMQRQGSRISAVLGELANVAAVQYLGQQRNKDWSEHTLDLLLAKKLDDLRGDFREAMIKWQSAELKVTLSNMLLLEFPRNLISNFKTVHEWPVGVAPLFKTRQAMNSIHMIRPLMRRLFDDFSGRNKEEDKRMRLMDWSEEAKNMYADRSDNSESPHRAIPLFINCNKEVMLNVGHVEDYAKSKKKKMASDDDESTVEHDGNDRAKVTNRKGQDGQRKIKHKETRGKEPSKHRGQPHEDRDRSKQSTSRTKTLSRHKSALHKTKAQKQAYIEVSASDEEDDSGNDSASELDDLGHDRYDDAEHNAVSSVGIYGNESSVKRKHSDSNIAPNGKRAKTEERSQAGDVVAGRKKHKTSTNFMTMPNFFEDSMKMKFQLQQLQQQLQQQQLQLQQQQLQFQHPSQQQSTNVQSQHFNQQHMQPFSQVQNAYIPMNGGLSMGGGMVIPPFDLADSSDRSSTAPDPFFGNGQT